MNILDTLKSVKKATENYLNSVQTPDEDYISKIYNYVVNIENLTKEESEFLNKVDELSELAHEDQCTGSNPR